MSVMLTSTKAALRKKSARPVKSARKRPVKPKSTGETSGACISAQNVKMWQFDGLEIIFRKDTMDVWVNDAKATVTTDAFSDDSEGATLEFECSIQSGKITTYRNAAGNVDQTLTLIRPGGEVVVPNHAGF